MKTQASANLKAAATARKKEAKHPPEPEPAAKKDGVVGILSFEVASAMSKAVHLHRSLSAAELSRLRTEVFKSHAVRTLVSADEARLLELVAAEKLDDLNRVAAVVSRLGKRCSEQTLVGFEHVYADLLEGGVEVAKMGFLLKDVESTIKKMERHVNSTATLYGELEVLNELEQGAKKLYLSPQYEDARRAYEQKIQWQKHEVKHLRESSLWNRTYDKVVALMARAVCTIYARVRQVFGETPRTLESAQDVPRQQRHPGQALSRRHRQLGSATPAQWDASQSAAGLAAPTPQRKQIAALRGESLGFHCGSTPGRLLMDCLSLSSSAAWKDDDDETFAFERESCPSRVGMSMSMSMSIPFGKPKFSLKTGSTMMRAPPSTVGGSALALHYANIIIIIEKLLRYPHLVGEEARDDLYQMLPTSLRAALRRALKSYVKEFAIYDAPVAHDWKGKLDKILAWLSPMAHDMIRWQTERNFEQQQIVSKANVLLLQTLYFADRDKAEAAICELLVGLNYICRYEHQQNALLDCRSSLGIDDCVDWQLQY